MKHPLDNHAVMVTLTNGEQMKACYENGCYWTTDPEDPDGTEAELPEECVTSWCELQV